MDVCECEGALWLLELNPFSGADLYACDPAAIVEHVSTAATMCAQVDIPALRAQEIEVAAS